jgi:hypothetical protein
MGQPVCPQENNRRLRGNQQDSAGKYSLSNSLFHQSVNRFHIHFTTVFFYLAFGSWLLAKTFEP